MREALFGSLGAKGAIEGTCVLDLYAGSGALALEALSRGAARATLVESSPQALAALRANVRALDLDRQTLVVGTDVARAAGRIAARAPFDLVFADPPWALVDSGVAPLAVADLLGGAGVLAAAALVVLEHSARTPPPVIVGLALEEKRRYGDTALAIYKPAILGPPRP